MDSSTLLETLELWNFWGAKPPETGISRPFYLQRLLQLLETGEILAVTGIRRSGKSTLLIQLLGELIHRRQVPAQNTLYANFEDPRFFNDLSIELLDQILRTYREHLKPQGMVYVVLDEIQKIKGWEHWVRALYDRKEKIRFCVTGSNADLLASEYASVLTGRHLTISVFPLSFEEYLFFHNVTVENSRLWEVKNKDLLNRLLLLYLCLGGFPKIALLENESLQKELLAQYFDDILTKDVAQRHKIKEVQRLKSLALLYSTHFTRPTNFNAIKKTADFSLSLDSIHRFSAYLENAYLIHFVKRFSYSLKNQMQTDRKVYFADNGLREATAYKISKDLGKLLKNAVFMRLHQLGKECYYFSEKQEVDFVIKEKGRICKLINAAYEISDKETLFRETQALREGMRYFNLKQGQIIVGVGEARSIKEKDLVFDILPFRTWALEKTL